MCRSEPEDPRLRFGRDVPHPNVEREYLESLTPGMDEYPMFEPVTVDQDGEA